MNQSLKQIGQYQIGDLISAHPSARRFSWWEKLLHKRAVPGEVLFQCEDRADFLGVRWRVVLGVAQDSIYKISATWGAKTQEEMEAKIVELVTFCNFHTGSEMKDSKECIYWPVSFGKVSMDARTVTSPLENHFIITFTIEATLRVDAKLQNTRN